MRNLVSYGVFAPPNIFIVLCFLSALLTLIWRRTGITIMLVSSTCLFITGTPAFSSFLKYYLASEIPENTDLSSAEAIVVLGADVRSGNGRERLGLKSLDRVEMAAEGYHQLRLPVAVSGGPIVDGQTSVAALMKAALIRDFGVPVTWTADSSRTTYENAVHTARLLRKENIRTVIVVTQAPDLARAIWSFERAGLHALPWPSPRSALEINRLEDFLPSADALDESFYGLHEIIGGIYYRFRY